MTGGVSDGKFTVQSGGITQNIAKELNLDSNQIKKLGSVWNQIMDVVKEEKASGNNIYTGGEDLHGSGATNFVVHVGQNIDLSKSWQKILDIVNNKLGTNFEKGNQEDTTPIQKGGAQATPQGETPPPESKENPPVDTTKTGAPKATATLERTKKEGEDLATELRNSFKDPDVNILRGQLAKITPENVAYVLDKYKSFYAEGIGDAASLAGRIRGVNAFGNGFDKKEVGLYIVRPLLIRANALGIECDLMQGKNIEDLSFKEMCAVIRDLQPKIVAADENGFVPQQNANYNEAIAVLNTGEVTEISNNKDNTIKTIKLKTGHQIRVEYDGNNEIKNIQMGLESLHQLTGYEEGSNKPTTDNLYDIIFTNDSVRTAQNYNIGYAENLTVQDYDFEVIKALVQKLLDSQETS